MTCPCQSRRKPRIGRARDPIFDEIESAIQVPKSLLDVGCGSDSPVQFLTQRPAHMVGVDAHPPSIAASRSKGIHDEYYCIELKDLDQCFGQNSFDCVLGIDVIEHFVKEDARRLLKMIERIAARRVVLLTPNGFLPQAAHSGNPFQEHLSGWTVEELQSLGYRVIGANGWKPLLGQFAQPRLRPAIFWRLVSRMSQPLVREHPGRAFHLLCVKEVSGINQA